MAKIRYFKITPDLSSLTENERRALSHCVRATRLMTDIYLEQAAYGNPEIYRELQRRSDKEGIDLLKYFKIHGSPWDSYNNNEPFVPGVGAKPQFGSFYPSDLTKKEWEAWLNAHPGDRDSFESAFTVIRRDNNSLKAVPYGEEYRDRLTEAAGELKSAAALLSSGALRSFLEMRATAFLSNDYFDSDMEWVDTDGYPFEVTIGPYEVYFDELLGLKASFEGFVAIPDKDATVALKRFTPLVPEFDWMLSEEFSFSPKGAAIPLEVVSEVARGGDMTFGYMFVAYNLPNDRRVHDLKGSKKVFSITMMEAKFETLIRPVAERILKNQDLDCCSFDNRLLFVLGHELAHGLGPTTVKDGDREVPFEVKLKDLHSCLEEAKADMLGMRLLNYFRKRGKIDDETMLGIIISEVASYFQGWRHGFTEAHARGHLVEYNWLKHHKAVRYDTASKTLDIDAERAIEAMELLSTEFLNLQVAGDYDKAKQFLEEWGKVPAEIPLIVESLNDLPTAVSPIYDLTI